MAYERGEDSLFRSSIATDPDSELVPQSQLLDPSNYKEKTVPAFDEADYQSHRNVYVGIHVPYSRSKHKHRGRRKSGSGQGKHCRSHRRSSDVSSTLEEVSLDGESLSLGGIEERRRSSFHGQSSEGEGLLKRPSYHKSLSAPSSRPRTPPNEPATLPTIMEPRTPADPCDRVKFILGGEEIDHTYSNGKHSVFTELEELKYDEHDHKMEWKETARWIKFEEDVEEGGNKWSKPHVATLSLHSLFELRSCLLKGTVILDMQADNLTHISDNVVENLVSSGQLEECFRDKVRCALLQKHKHLNSRKEHHENKVLNSIRSLGEIGRLGSSVSKQMDAEETSINGGAAPANNKDHNGSNASGFGGFALSAPSLFGGKLSSLQRQGLANGSTAETRLGEESNGSSDPDLAQTNKPGSFMKKIPPGSEASNVLVGEVDFLSHPIIAFVRLANSQVLGDLTEIPIPTRFLFILLGPKGNQERFHEIGRSIATLMSDEVFHEVAYKARNRGDLLAGIDEFLDKVTVLPPGEWDPQIRLAPPEKVPSQNDRRIATDPKKEQTCKKVERKSRQPPVKWFKRPFRGLVEDSLRCYSLYRSDILDAFSLQGLASLILIYFANITLAFTFGAFLSDITHGSLGATEMILAVGIGNLIFSIFSGQPLVILGPTGPTIIFEQIIFNFCFSNGIPFLNFRFWIGMWSTLFMIGLVAFNTSAVMKLFTRFTEEIFTAVVGFIFIYEAFARLWLIHRDHPYNQWFVYPTMARKCDCFEFPSVPSLETLDFTNATNLGSYWADPQRNCSAGLHRRYIGDDCQGKSIFLNHDVFLMSVILFFGTFLLCYYIKSFNHSRFFRTFIRKLVSDFAVFISVVVWVVVDVLAQVNTPKLTVNSVFEEGLFTQANRTSIFINPLGSGLPSWAPAAAIIPALLATILLFVDQHITALIVNRKDNKLKKGPGYHLDLLIVGCLIFLHSALGLPWVVGATVVSISHVQSLYLYSPCTAPGERPKFLGVREQRVTLFVCAILVGLSVMAYTALNLLPLPVLYGLLLYMGVASLHGIQFIERIKLFFIPSKRRPDCEYFRRIPNYRIHIFTVIQLAFFVVLCVFLGVQVLKVAFPVMVLTLLLGRWMLGFCFPHSDLDLLDDPLPKELYCRRFHEQSPSSKDVESGAAGLEESDDYTDNGEVPPVNLNEAVTSEPVGEEDLLSARNALFGVKKDSNFNITQEMDKCDLWKNMVKNYDAPPQSPRRSVKDKGSAPIIMIEETDEAQHQPISKRSACRRLQYQSTAV